MKKFSSLVLVILMISSTGLAALASSHREAPQITHSPKVDGTDLYAFRSYETGRDGFITIVANYDPLQDAYGGPNYFTLDENALYDIKIDNDGDAKEDLSFRFKFSNTLTNDGKGQTLTIGEKEVSIALANVGSFTAADESNRSRSSTYTIDKITGQAFKYGKTLKPRKGKSVTNSEGGTSFAMPEANIGNKSVADYAAYADTFIHDITIPGCDTAGKVFVGQRKESFQVNLGEIFDLVNTSPTGAVDGEVSDTADKNITSIALEIPTECLVESDDQPIIGIWTTASIPAREIRKNTPSFLKPVIGSKTAYTQVSRLGMALVNEVVIGLPDKDSFNASQPRNDAQFLTYVTNPTIPTILEVLFGVSAPTNFPRTDLITAFLTGVSGLNQVEGVTASEMLRLNTSTAVTASGSQNKLGVIAGDNAGYPNGRRPGDDVVDITLRVAMGVLQTTTDTAASKDLAYTDGADNNENQFDTSFPYLKDPIAGSPN